MDTNDAGNRDDGQRDGRHVERQMGPLINVGNFGTRQEAEIARGVLQENGIPAFVQGGEMATTLSVVGTALGGVVLEVPRSRATDAIRILDEQLSSDLVAAWKCPQCGAEVDAGFEICWQCSAAFPGGPRLPRQRDVEQRLRGDQIVDRAVLATFFGIIFCFPLVFYAFFVLGDARNAELSDGARRRLKWVQIVLYGYVLAILGWILFLLFWYGISVD